MSSTHIRVKLCIVTLWTIDCFEANIGSFAEFFEKNLESQVLSAKNLQLLHRTVELQGTVELQLAVKARGLGFMDFPQVIHCY